MPIPVSVAEQFDTCSECSTWLLGNDPMPVVPSYYTNWDDVYNDPYPDIFGPTVTIDSVTIETGASISHTLFTGTVADDYDPTPVVTFEIIDSGGLIGAAGSVLFSSSASGATLTALPGPDYWIADSADSVAAGTISAAGVYILRAVATDWRGNTDSSRNTLTAQEVTLFLSETRGSQCIDSVGAKFGLLVGIDPDTGTVDAGASSIDSVSVRIKSYYPAIGAQAATFYIDSTKVYTLGGFKSSSPTDSTELDWADSIPPGHHTVTIIGYSSSGSNPTTAEVFDIKVMAEKHGATQPYQLILDNNLSYEADPSVPPATSSANFIVLDPPKTDSTLDSIGNTDPGVWSALEGQGYVSTNPEFIFRISALDDGKPTIKFHITAIDSVSATLPGGYDSATYDSTFTITYNDLDEVYYKGIPPAFTYNVDAKNTFIRTATDGYHIKHRVNANLPTRIPGTTTPYICTISAVNCAGHTTDSTDSVRWEIAYDSCCECGTCIFDDSSYVVLRYDYRYVTVTSESVITKAIISVDSANIAWDSSCAVFRDSVTVSRKLFANNDDPPTDSTELIEVYYNCALNKWSVPSLLRDVIRVDVGLGEYAHDIDVNDDGPHRFTESQVAPGVANNINFPAYNELTGDSCGGVPLQSWATVTIDPNSTEYEYISIEVKNNSCA